MSKRLTGLNRRDLWHYSYRSLHLSCADEGGYGDTLSQSALMASSFGPQLGGLGASPRAIR